MSRQLSTDRARSDRGPCAKRAADWREQPKKTINSMPGTLARLARTDPGLLGPVRHRSAQAQIHLTVIGARAALVSTRTALVNARTRFDEIVWRAAEEVREQGR